MVSWRNGVLYRGSMLRIEPPRAEIEALNLGVEALFGWRNLRSKKNETFFAFLRK